MDFSACTDFPDSIKQSSNSPKFFRISPKITKTNITFPLIGNRESDIVTKLNEEFFRVNLGYIKPDARRNLKNSILSHAMPPLLSVSPNGFRIKGCEHDQNLYSEINFKYCEGNRLKIGKYHHRCQTANELEDARQYRDLLNQKMIKNFRVIRKELLPQTKASELNKGESPTIGLKIKGIMKNFTTRKKVKRL